jgi:UDP-GlcNAc3NAcA epimerase
MKVLSVVGARPQFVKAAVLSRELRERHTEVLLHTGQHYDDLMSDVFFRDLGLPAPDLNLGVGSGKHGWQTARALEGIETAIEARRPDVVIVYGDTNSTLAGALAAAKLNVPLAHVEAGLRSYDRSMPEEVNRVLTDHVASYLFCPTQTAIECLKKEGIGNGVHLVGDLMYDSLLAALKRVEEKEAAVLEVFGVAAGSYCLATIHRPATTDDPRVLSSVFAGLARLETTVILPMHPRTKAAVASGGISPEGGVRVVDPVGYLEMVALERNARCILTDSGGVQREAYFLSVPCVTLRTESEWPETLTDGWNVLAGTDPDKIAAAAARPRPENEPEPVFGDGNAASKIVEILERDPPNG